MRCWIINRLKYDDDLDWLISYKNKICLFEDLLFKECDIWNKFYLFLYYILFCLVVYFDEMI